MLRIVLVCFSTVVIQSLNAQSGSVTSGGNVSNQSGTINYSIGQVACTFFSNGGISVTAGLQQSFRDAASTKPDNYFSVYPNPALREFVTLKTSIKDVTNYSFQLFDLDGKLLTNEHLQGKETVVNLTGLSAAAYLITVQNQGQQITAFKIIKK